MNKGASFTFNGKSKPVVHNGYTDLGDYVIDLGEITKEEFDKGVKIVNEKMGSIPKTACTAVVKRNLKGEVIIGRNQDMEVSNYPAYISHLASGRYKAVTFFYNNTGDATYEELKGDYQMTDGFRGLYSVVATDAFNECGLYVQWNMRTSIGASSGTNPGRQRFPMGTLAALIAANCSTVKETLKFLKEEVDVYSASANPDDPGKSGWEAGYLVSDATGEYGIIEFFKNRIYFTPYPNGHCNAFVSPKLFPQELLGSGYGRLDMAIQSMFGAETEAQMLEAIHKADWRREIEDIEYSHLDEAGRACFVDKDGNPSIDYRPEAPGMFPIDDDGKFMADVPNQAEFQKLCYSVDWISKADAALPIFRNKKQEMEEELKDRLEKTKRMVSERNYHKSTARWLLDDANFEEAKKCYLKYFSNQNAFELIRQFNAGDEKAIRDQGDVFTTGMNFGVNCAKKHLMVRFWEHDDAIYEVQW